MLGREGKPEVRATIKIRYSTKEMVRAILGAVSPDNLMAPRGISIEAETRAGELQITIVCAFGIGSFIATIDDLLSCIQSAERAISGLLP